MVVVSNASPLIYFAKMGEFDIPKKLFTEVIVSDKVFEEVVIQGAGKPGSEEVKGAVWIKRRTVSDKAAVQKLRDVELLDAGESETLVLAQELKADLTILDDRKARKVASKLKVRRIGSVAVILMAYRKGLIEDLPLLLKKANEKAFRLNEKVFKRLKQRVAVRQSGEQNN